jgi:hypothetical protein
MGLISLKANHRSQTKQNLCYRKQQNVLTKFHAFLEEEKLREKVERKAMKFQKPESNLFG